MGLPELFQLRSWLRDSCGKQEEQPKKRYAPMKSLVQIENSYLCAGLIIDHNRVLQAAPILKKFIRPDDTWPVLRNRLLSKGFSVWEKMENFLGDPPHGPQRCA